MTYIRHHTIDHYLSKVRLHTTPYQATILDMDIVIYPGVMSPLYDRSSRIFISQLEPQTNKCFLEVGSGTGIVSVWAAKTGAKKIVAIDITSQAVENTRANFDLHGIDAQTFQSDLFDKVEGTFDTIFFNAPFHGNKPVDDLELGVSDYNYQTLLRFLSQVKEYLNPDGKVYLGFSDMGDNDLLREYSEKNGLQIINRSETVNGDWTAYLYTISPK